MLRGGRSFASARHWHPVLRIYIIPFTTSRISTVRLLPPRLAGGISGPISAHSASVRSLSQCAVGRAYRARFSSVHILTCESMREAGNHRGFSDFKDNPLTDSKDSICSRTDTQMSASANAVISSTGTRVYTNGRPSPGRHGAGDGLSAVRGLVRVMAALAIR